MHSFTKLVFNSSTIIIWDKIKFNRFVLIGANINIILSLPRITSYIIMDFPHKGTRKEYRYLPYDDE